MISGLALLLFFCLLIIVVNHLVAKKYFVEEKQRTMINAYEKINEAIEAGGDFKEIIKHYETIHNLHAVIAVSDEVLYRTDTNAVLETSSFNEQPFFYTNYKDNHNESLYLTVFIRSKQDYQLQLDTPISAIDQSVDILNKLLTVIMLVTMFAFVILIWFMSRHFTGPLVRIERVASKISHCEFDEKLTVDRQDELGSLCTSINIMSEQLSQMFERLNEANKHLKEVIAYEKRLDRMRQSFIASASHELKSPLSLLVMYCENLKNNLSDVDRDFYYEVIIEESNRLSQLVSKLLSVSSLENDLIQMKSRTFDFGALIQWVIKKHDVMFIKGNKQATISIEKDLFVYGDPTYIEQVVNNLIDNAITYSKDAQIRLHVYRSYNEVHFEIYNKSDVLDEHVLSSLFSSFYKVNENETHGNHIGLGLFIVKKIIEAHQGNCGAKMHLDEICFNFTLRSTHETNSQSTQNDRFTINGL